MLPRLAVPEVCQLLGVSPGTRAFKEELAGQNLATATILSTVNSTGRKFIIQNPNEVTNKLSKGICAFLLQVDERLKIIFLGLMQYLKTDLRFGNDAPLFPKTRMVQDENDYFKAEAKCNTRCRWDTGWWFEPLRVCCHASLLAPVRGRKRSAGKRPWSKPQRSKDKGAPQFVIRNSYAGTQTSC